MKLTGVQSAQLADNELSNVDGLADLHLLSSLNLSVCLLHLHADDPLLCSFRPTAASLVVDVCLIQMPGP